MTSHDPIIASCCNTCQPDAKIHPGYYLANPPAVVLVQKLKAGLFANLSARAICRTHEKSYLAEKVLFIGYSSLNPSFMFTSAIFE